MDNTANDSFDLYYGLFMCVAALLCATGLKFMAAWSLAACPLVFLEVSKLLTPLHPLHPAYCLQVQPELY